MGRRAAVPGRARGAFAVPSPFGQNALRLGVLAGPSVLALAHRKRSPSSRWPSSASGCSTCSGCRPCGRWPRRTATPPPASPSRPRRGTSYRVAKPGERVEVPMTVNHWEAADLAKVVPLARGWERQLDQKANPIFYDDEPLTASTLPRLAARERGPLGRAAQRAAGLLRARGGAGARARGEVPQARLRVAALADLGGARHRSARLRRREAARRGAELVHGRRVQTTSCATATRAYWSTSDACLSRAPGGWTGWSRERRGRHTGAGRFGMERAAAQRGVNPRACTPRFLGL